MLSNLFAPDTVDAAVGAIKKTIERLTAIRAQQMESAAALRNMADVYLAQADKAETEASRAAEIVRNLGNLIGAGV